MGVARAAVTGTVATARGAATAAASMLTLPGLILELVRTVERMASPVAENMPAMREGIDALGTGVLSDISAAVQQIESELMPSLLTRVAVLEDAVTILGKQLAEPLDTVATAMTDDMRVRLAHMETSLGELVDAIFSMLSAIPGARRRVPPRAVPRA